MRVTRIFTTERAAHMVERCNRREGFAHTRIDTTPEPEAHQPRFFILASHEPLDGVPFAWTDEELLNA